MLTVAKLLEAKRVLEAVAEMAAEPPRWDLYAHNLGDGKCYTFPWTQPGQDRGRRKVLVPPEKLLPMFHAMKAEGIDVRLEPRYEMPPGDAAIVAELDKA